jgi:farnesyl-diphosphate farnesyltransferase
MREPVSLAYLLARTSDTIADCTAAAERKSGWLRSFEEALAGAEGGDFQGLADHTSATGEKLLIRHVPELIAAFQSCPKETRDMIEQVVRTIISGQSLDLSRFCEATMDHPKALASREELDDYTWRVAGCVGEFWTRIGIHTLGEGFSRANPDLLCEAGIRYGKGLQIVNIIRDLGGDLRQGRCYLPVADPMDRAAMIAERAWWIKQAKLHLAEGIEYARHLRGRRVRIASGLPASLGLKTLAMLEAQHGSAMSTRIKIPRSEVYRSLAALLASSLSRPAR